MASCVKVNQLIVVFFVCLTFRLTAQRHVDLSKDEYLKVRNEFITAERKSSTGGNLTLTSEEQKVNGTLMKWKELEISIGHRNGSFIPGMHFFHARKIMESSSIFKFIRKMPKGGALHVHDGALSSMRWLVANATYDQHCYMCIDSDGHLRFHFYKEPPQKPECSWLSVVKERAKYSDPQEFDQWLYNNLTLIVPDPEVRYRSQQDVWDRFQFLFLTISDLVFYGPVFRAHFYHSLQEFYDDGVQFIEMRGLLPPVYELDGSTHDTDWIVKSYIDISEQFKKAHPDFIGIRIIYTTSRVESQTTSIEEAIKQSVRYRRMYPDHFAGFDLVGDENLGKSLFSMIDQLLIPSQQNLDLPFFFHAGETFWQDYKADANVVDAILLNTTRVGHGYSITKHPAVMELIRKKQIPIEVCPISNQVLMLVANLCNHPAAALLSEGHPVVISSDDPGIWGSSGLSYDFYETLMGLGGEWADLATLKQLAINSIRYSSLPDQLKSKAFDVWNLKWKEFIGHMARHM